MMRPALCRKRVALALLVWGGLASASHAQEISGPASPVEVSGSINVNSKGANDAFSVR